MLELGEFRDRRDIFGSGVNRERKEFVDSGFDHGGDWFCDSFCRYLARNSRGNDGAGILSLRAWGTATASLNTVSAPALSSAFAGTRMLSRQEGWDKRYKIQNFPVIMSNLVG